MPVQDELLSLCAMMHADGVPLNYDTLRARRGRGSRRDIGQALRIFREQIRPVALLASTAESSDLHFTIAQQREKIESQAEEIRELREEMQALVRKYRELRGLYPEDFED